MLSDTENISDRDKRHSAIGKRFACRAPGGGENPDECRWDKMVPLLHGEWEEPWTLVVGEVQPAVRQLGK